MGSKRIIGISGFVLAVGLLISGISTIVRGPGIIEPWRLHVPFALGAAFLPALLALSIGLWLFKQSADRDKESPSNAFKTKGSLGIGAGIALMLLGGGLAQQGPEYLLAGAVAALGGWGLLIGGCVHYSRWKGYSGWFGLFGYMLLPGLLVLACLPNRRKRLLGEHRAEQIAAGETLALTDRTSGSRYLLALIPLGVLFLSLGGFVLFLRSDIDAAEWQEVAPLDLGFQALVPGTPRREQQTQETPAGKVEVHKFMVEPKGKKELFLIVSIRFPETLSRALGGTEKLLELGRQDFLAASAGQIQSERRIALGGYTGVEMEVLPPKGAIVKVRIYATRNQIYQVAAHVPKIRLTSEDVQKFFNSFHLSAEPSAAHRPTSS